jgi:hypothetical protein
MRGEVNWQDEKMKGRGALANKRIGDAEDERSHS